MKTYQIYASSLIGEGASTSHKTYKFDWSIIPEGEYEMTFQFMSEISAVSHANAELTTSSMKLSIDMPFSTDKYEVNTNGTASSTQLMGFLEITDEFKADGNVMRIWKARYMDNAPVIIKGKPQGNIFVVKTLQHNGTVGQIAPYDLLINLKHIC